MRNARIYMVMIILVVLSLQSCIKIIENQLYKAKLRKIRLALEEDNLENRNYAMSILKNYSGDFSIRQVCEIYSYVYNRWQYFSDPYGTELYSPVSNTINNNFRGDCDDFALVIASLIHSIGGKVRITIAKGDEFSHAYTEVYLSENPDNILEEVNYHYQGLFQYLFGISAVDEINYIEDEESGIWLNLDWNSRYPGGEYFISEHKVIFYPYENYFMTY